MSTPPFHRLLAFYSNLSSYPDTQTIRLTDSLRGNLSLGLDFPAALGVAIGRHLWLRNTSVFSLNIHVPSVPVRETLLEGVVVDEKRNYERSELVKLAKERNGWSGGADALGLWSLVADVKTGLIRGEDVRAFQRGVLLERVVERRRFRGEGGEGLEGQVLPLWRGGPISVAGHSWFVKMLFDVDVYQDGTKKD